MTEFHGVILALEFCCWLAAIGVSIVLALCIMALASQINKTGDEDEDD